MAGSASPDVDMENGFEEALDKSITFQQLMAEMRELKAARDRAELKIAVLEAAKEKEQISRCKPADPEKFQEGGRVRINAWLDAMESYLQAGNTAPKLWVDLAKTYLETKVAQHWQIIAKNLQLEGKDAKDWVLFKEALIKAYGNVNPEQLARAKLAKLTQTSSVESYANKFQNLCAEIITLPMSVGDKIHRFIAGLKPEIRLKVAVDPMNNAQPWEDFQRLVTYAVSIDANLQQVRASLGEAPNKSIEKKNPTTKEGAGGPIKAKKKSLIKFDDGREIDYKKVASLKKEGKCYYCEEKGHRASNCPKNAKKSSGEKKDF
jgi:hypothetical protein